MDVEQTCFSLPINPNHFPSKLWRLVNDPQIRSICWDTSGEGILIYQEPFEEEVLISPNEQTREYFKTTSIISFFRQLNLYGFRKVHPDHDISEKKLGRAFISAQMHHFQNMYFKRANPELLVNLKRLTPDNKAKIAAGKKLTSRSTRRFCYPMLNSPEGNSAVMKNGPLLVEETPHIHHGHGFQDVNDCDRAPEPSQAFVMGHDDPGSGFHHFPMDSPCSHQSSCMHIHEGSSSSMPAETYMPHHSQYRYYTPVFQYHNPGSLDSNMRCSHQPAAANAYCGHYPNCFVGYHHCTGQHPNWQAGEPSDPRESDMNLVS